LRSLARLIARTAACLATCLVALALLAAAPARAQLTLPGTEPEAAPPAEEATSVAEALRLLAIVLDDPDARAALVDQLRAAEAAVATPATEPAPGEPEIDLTIPQLIADQTLAVVEDVSDGVIDVLRALVDIGAFVGNFRTFDFRSVEDGLLGLALTIATTLLAFWLLRVAARPILTRLEARAAEETPGLLPVWKFAATVAEALVVTVAWAFGIGVAVVSFEAGEIMVPQGLFLHAFLVTELTRVGIRSVFRPRYRHLRLFLNQETTARHWNFWLSRIAGVLGYGLLFVVPLVEPEASPDFTEWVRLLTVVLAYGMALLLVLRNRRRVRAAFEERIAHLPEDVIATGLGALARIWHLLAIGYITALFVVWRTHPGDAEAFMLRATGYSALAILVGSLAIGYLTRRIAGGIQISDKVRRELPLLESRLNSFVPATLMALRIAVFALIAVVILTVWGLVDFAGWIATPIGRSILSSLAWVAAILFLAGTAWIVVSSWVEYRLNPDVGRPPTPRERTLLALFSNAFIIVLLVITLMSVLNEIGINIAPLLAGAGVVGLAIGFGAQQLVRDIINGAFIQFENTMNEGDVVTAGGVTGVVEKLTIRSVSLRSLDGTYHMIPFSGVDMVTNFMKGFSYHVAEIGVAYRESVTEVKAAMHEAFDRLMETEHRANILPPLDMQGLVAFGDSAVVVRARIKTLPGQQWAAGRAYNELIKEVFDARGIEIPFPHQTIYFGENKDGTAPPLNIRDLDRRREAPAAPAAPGAAPASDITPPDRALTPPGAEED
jgi:moderate conductance mechanosensitive channel